MYICPHGTGKSSTIHQSETAFYANGQSNHSLEWRSRLRCAVVFVANVGYNCEAAHCNFHLRGKESDRDEAFVCQLCAKRQVPLHIVHFNTVRTAEERHISIEMAARELRYEWFEEIRRKSGANVIAVAHHRDDSAAAEVPGEG